MAIIFERSKVLHLTCDCCSPWGEGWRLTPEYGGDWYYVEHVLAGGEVKVLGKGPLPDAKRSAIRAHDAALKLRQEATAHKCADPDCPGLPYPASQQRHPAPCRP